MEMDDSAPATPGEPVLIDAGPEVDQFAKLLDSCLCFKGSLEDKRVKLLELPRQYHDVTVKRLKALFPQPVRNGDVDMMDEDDDAAELSRDDEVLRASLTKEAQTWDLLGRVLPLRSPSAESTTRDSRMRQAADKDDDTFLGSFFKGNLAARERRAVLQWLQTNASYGAPIDDVTRELQHKAERGDLTSNGWLHTRHEIKNKKSLLGWPHLLDRQQASGTMESHKTKKGDPMISQLDPDACARQGRHLQPADAYFEEAIWLGCFELLRRGSSLEEIRSWCLERTESWRAISISGLVLSRHHEDVADCTSPASVALWRRMCYALAHKGTSDMHEAAVYGLLSGDISTVERVAKTWEDFLFAHYNALLRAQIDAYILDLCPPAEAAHMVQSFPSYNAVQARGDEGQADIQIVHSLSLKDTLRPELDDPYKRLQSAILSRNLDGYFLAQGHGFSSDNCREGYFHEWQHDGLRMVANIYALSTLIQIIDAHSSGTILRNKDAETLATESSIISEYASFLRRASLEELIPTYCSVLRSQARFDILSENLIMEEDIGRRRTLLTLMEKTGIDVFEFVEGQAAGYYEKVVEAQTKDAEEPPVFQCLGDGSSSVRVGRGIKADFFGEDEDDVEPNHARLVRSIEWLKLVQGTWPSVLAWGADAYKAFLRNVDLRSARVLMNTVPFASVVSDCLGLSEEEDQVSNENIEFWKAQLIDIGDPDTDPKRVMQNARTYRELESLVRALDKIEDISAFVQFATEIEDKSKADQKSFWDEVRTATYATKDSMQPLLNNWLMAGIQGGDAQLKHIRQTYLPETILAYVTALHFAGTGISRDFLLESMNLATIVSDKDGDLEETFVKAKRVKELLEAFTASSKALAMATGEKRAAGSSSKKLRELGWTRDLWSVKS